VVLLALVGVAYSAVGAASIAKYRNPPGAMKLAKGKVARVGKMVCGRPGAEWMPGSILPSGYFISDARQADNNRAFAAHAKGKTKARYLALGKTYSERAKARQPTCWHLSDPLGSVKLAKANVKRTGAVA
jgi:hypothetical protein